MNSKSPSCCRVRGDWQAQDAFAEMYEKFMDEKPADVEVLFADAVHPQHNTMAAYGWMKKGERRGLPTNTGRERLNLHGAINADSIVVGRPRDKHANPQNVHARGKPRIADRF